MDLTYLKEFLRLAELCNFQEAADELHISQSSLSKHVKSIEEELGGIQLFDRTTRSVTLNKSGRFFYSKVKNIIEKWDECVVDVAAFNKRNDHQLNIGFSAADGWQYGTAELMVMFLEIHPEVVTNMKHFIKFNLMAEDLIAGRCDFVFAPDVIEDDRVTKRLYNVDTLALVCNKLHPFATYEKISFSDLENEKFVMHDDSSHFTRRLNDLCKAEGFLPNIVMTIASRGNMLKMIEKGVGITVMFKQQAKAISNSLDLAFVDIDPPIRRNIYMQYCPKRKMTKTAENFLTFIESDLK